MKQGLRAARANVVPGAALWLVGFVIVAAYYHHPPTHAALAALAGFKERVGFPFAIVSTAVVAGLLPVLIQQAMPGLPSRAALGELPFALGFWGLKGLEVDLIYRAQAAVFGHSNAPAVVAAKSAVDQFVLVPLWFVPVMTLAYLWKDSGLSWSEARRRLGPRWYRRRCVPVLLSNWAVWIPAVPLIYALPTPLQLPIQNVVLCLWVLMLMFLTSSHDRPAGAPADPERPLP